MSDRLIFKHNWHSQADVTELLQAVFAAELIAPSAEVYVVSPWISDIPIVDNRAGGFDTVMDASWGQRHIRLAEILARLALLGSTVVVATRPDAHNQTFLTRLRDRTDPSAFDRLVIHEAEELHEKGILTDRFLLGGSMNITYGGVMLLEEAVRFTTDPEDVALAKLAYTERWDNTGIAAP